MKKIYLFFAALIAAVAVSVAVVPTNTYAEACKTDHVLGLRAWYDGLATGDPCLVPSNAFDEAHIQQSVWLIVLNLVSMVLGIVGYLAICFVIWGGYQYMLANGDLIGLAVCMLASTISGMVSDIVAEGAASGNIFTTAMNHAFTWAAIIAVIVIIIGGIQYTTSAGNPGAVQKAKQTIMYAAIGLAISLLAVAIVNLVVGAL